MQKGIFEQSAFEYSLRKIRVREQIFTEKSSSRKIVSNEVKVKNIGQIFKFQSIWLNYVYIRIFKMSKIKISF